MSSLCAWFSKWFSYTSSKKSSVHMSHVNSCSSVHIKESDVYTCGTDVYSASKREGMPERASCGGSGLLANAATDPR
jgi:hypothetical protein